MFDISLYLKYPFFFNLFFLFLKIRISFSTFFGNIGGHTFSLFVYNFFLFFCKPFDEIRRKVVKMVMTFFPLGTIISSVNPLMRTFLWMDVKVFFGANMVLLRRAWEFRGCFQLFIQLWSNNIIRCFPVVFLIFIYDKS